MKKKSKGLFKLQKTVWVFQTGEPLHIDKGNPRPMRAMNLSNALVDAGYNVILWSSAFYHQEKCHRSKEDNNVKYSDNLEIRLIHSFGYKRNIGLGRLIDHAHLAFRLYKVLKNIKQDEMPNFVFIGYPPIETAYVLSSWCKKNGIPSLLDVKDQWPEIFIDPLPNFIKKAGRMALFPYFYFARRAMQNAVGISTMSDGFMLWALSFINRDRNEWDAVFPLTTQVGTVLKNQIYDAEKWWDSISVTDNNLPRLCFVGSLSRAFDFETIYNAAKILLNQNIKCEFIICGHGEASEDVKLMIADLNIIKLPGWIDRPKIEVLAKRSIAALAPYKNIDNFIMNVPNKIIDYMSLSLPVISPLRGEVEYLITKYRVGLKYEEGDEVSLSDKIKELLLNVKLRDQISYNAKNTYNKIFSFEKVYESFVSHIEKMARNRH